MNNANIILTKNVVLQKVQQVLAGTQQELVAAPVRPHAAFAPLPKISRGENYIGLPYLVLDYPRLFEGTHIFLVRSMFWWGRSLSSTLHLAGRHKNNYLEAIQNSYATLAKGGYSIGINEDPWQHHFGADNYTPIDSLTAEGFAACCNRLGHLKIARSWSLDDVASEGSEWVRSWAVYLRILDLIAA